MIFFGAAILTAGKLPTLKARVESMNYAININRNSHSHSHFYSHFGFQKSQKPYFTLVFLAF